MSGFLGDRPAAEAGNCLFYGDNLTVMRRLPSACVDLIYLDPPFNSQRSYNLIYKQATGLPVPEQEEAFCDSWELDAEKEEMARRMPIVLQSYGADESLIAFWQAWINALRNTQPQLLAYLVYMSYRLLEMRRLLRPTGSIYLHCDPTASHYIKVIMDGIFGHENFRNEIIWVRSTNPKGSQHKSRRWSPFTDTILFYAKSRETELNVDAARRKLTPEETVTKYDRRDELGWFTDGPILRSPSMGERPNLVYEYKGYVPDACGWRVRRELLEEIDAQGNLGWSATGKPYRKLRPTDDKGVPLGSCWSDISFLISQAEERLGFPTQKPIQLLDRIVRASSKAGDVVFDPFCGCGTAIYAAHRAGRRWLGCDIAILSVQIVRNVLRKRYGLEEKKHFEVSGIPLSVEGAKELFEHDPRQFQHWVVELAGGFVSKQHSGDRGIDGRIYFETQDGLKSMVLSVKGGRLSPAFVRELRGVLEREAGTWMAGFICLQEPTRGMRTEAAMAGQFEYNGHYYDRLQIRTAKDILDHRGFDTPTTVQIMDWQRQQVLAF